MQIFPFYTEKKRLNHNKTWCQEQKLFKHYLPFTHDSTNPAIRFPAFQFEVSQTGIDIVILRSNELGNIYNPVVDIDITSEINIGLHQSAAGSDYYQHNGQTATLINVAASEKEFEGKSWYLEIVINGTSFYSENFTTVPVVEDVLPCGDWVFLDYTANKNIGALNYENNFRQTILLPTEVGRPKYEYKEEGEEDGKGEFFQTMKRVEKTFVFEFFAPEYLTDALATLPLHPAAILFSNYEIFNINDVKFDLKEWETDCIARCEITFQTDFVAARGTL